MYIIGKASRLRKMMEYNGILKTISDTIFNRKL